MTFAEKLAKELEKVITPPIKTVSYDMRKLAEVTEVHLHGFCDFCSCYLIDGEIGIGICNDCNKTYKQTRDNT